MDAIHARHVGAYGVDANGDGRRDPADPAHAIHAAARYLRASGAPGDWYRAIFAYNHADWYVQEVQALADAYQGGSRIDPASDPGATVQADGSLSWPVAGPVTSWSCGWSLARGRWLVGSDSAFVGLVDQACATRAPRQGDRRVGVLRRPPTVRAG